MTPLIFIIVLLASYFSDSFAHIHTEELEDLQQLETQWEALHNVENSVFKKLKEELDRVRARHVSTRRRVRETKVQRCGLALQKYVNEVCGELRDNEVVGGYDIGEQCCVKSCSTQIIMKHMCPKKLTV
uniref:Insulin-like domain-containing protein n=1 Tax=Caenorhabditis japonica TaxID=281687 RepID=A0A8R1IQG0_CAEJA